MRRPRLNASGGGRNALRSTFIPFSSHPFFLFQKGAIDGLAIATNAIGFEATSSLGVGRQTECEPKKMGQRKAAAHEV